VSLEQLLGAAGDLVEVGQIKLDNAGRTGTRESCRGFLTLGHVAYRQHDVGAVFNQAAGSFEADAAIGTGHNEGTSSLLRQLPRMPGHESASCMTIR